eukprot:1106553-Rhodomonas_salina.1
MHLLRLHCAICLRTIAYAQPSPTLSLSATPKPYPLQAVQTCLPTMKGSEHTWVLLHPRDPPRSSTYIPSPTLRGSAPSPPSPNCNIITAPPPPSGSVILAAGLSSHESLFLHPPAAPTLHAPCQRVRVLAFDGMVHVRLGV